MLAETLLILTLAGEARNQGEAGMRAVASVIHYKALEDSQYNMVGAEVPSVAALIHEVRTPHRYSVWRHGKYTQSFRGQADDRALLLAAQIASEMMRGSFRPTVKANHYHTVDVRPAWRYAMKRVGRRGSHIFYWKG